MAGIYGGTPQHRFQSLFSPEFSVELTFNKALALIAHSLPAISIRGIHQWHKKGSRELHDALTHFATPKRTLYIVMDMEKETRKQINVRRETLKLSEELEKLGCKIRIPIWEHPLGKGVDGALHQGDTTQAWFDELIETAPTLKDYKRPSNSNGTI